MINNPVLDVAIGLIFIYVLYSLLATTVKELVATLFAYRSRMLERGIEQMLDGVNYRYFWWDKLAQRIYALIRRHTWLRTITRPLKWAAHIIHDISAYFYSEDLEDDNAAGTLLEKKQIKAPVRRNKPKTFHDRAVASCLDSEDKFIKSRKLCKKHKLFAAEFTHHCLYLRAAGNSRFSKKPAYLTSDTFSDILIDLLSPKLGNNTPVLLKDIAKNIENRGEKPADALCPSTAKILNLYIAQANGDLVRFKLLIEKWYDDTMDRVSGWYKRQAFWIVLIIGFLLAVIFNVNTIDIVQKLSSDKPARDAMIKSASDYLKSNPALLNTAAKAPADNDIKISEAEKKDILDKQSKAQTTLLALMKQDSLIKTDTAAKTAIKKQIYTVKKQIVAYSAQLNPTQTNTNTAAAGAAAVNTTDESIKKIKEIYGQNIEQANTTLGLGWNNHTETYKADSVKWAADSAVAVMGDPSLKKAYPDFLKSIKESCICAVGLIDTTKKIKQYKADMMGDPSLKDIKRRNALEQKIGAKPQPADAWYKIGDMLYHMWMPKNLIGFLITALAISLGAPFWFDLLNKFINLRAAGAKPDDKDTGASKTAELNRQPAPNSFA